MRAGPRGCAGGCRAAGRRAAAGWRARAGAGGGGEGGGVADGGAVDAEQGAGEVDGKAQMVAETDGEHVVERVDPALAVRAGAVPDGVDAPAAAADVVVLLAAGAGRDLQGGGQRVQGRRVQAGQRGAVQHVPGAAPGRGRPWFRLRGRPGYGPDRVVPLASDGPAGPDAVFEEFHPLIADSLPRRVG